MITAERLQVLTTLSTDALILAVGIKSPRFKSARFIGLSNGNQFCYQVTYNQQAVSIKNVPADSEITTKVFITYDPLVDKVVATLI